VNILDTLLKASERESEKKSWDEITAIVYEIYYQRFGHWCKREMRQQTDDYPHGWSREEAMQFAGANGRVFESRITRKRIK